MKFLSLEVSENQNVTELIQNREKEKKKRKKNSYIIPVFFNFVLGHFLNSIYLYPYIFIYIYLYILFTIKNTMDLTDYLVSFCLSVSLVL